MKVAQAVGCKRLGLTHHDPASTDEDILNILKEGEAGVTDPELEVFACADYMELTL